ncbi:MAG TPA: glutamate--tRNA ligase, partial [Acidobacteriaceae bacterium]|nr:glutamate--tRNA ligase [Acidobacteriaceae bacterium]
WIGLDWDEGPFFQSRRLELYQSIAGNLLQSGRAYRCFCTKGQLEERRRGAEAAGRPPMYDRACRAIDPDLAVKRQQEGEACAIRFAVPSEGSTVFDDAVFGAMEFSNAELEDFVLLRSDGIPTYHLSVVADDLEMRLTHIIRGADHLSNTPKQVLLYRALDKPLPIFAHVPLILGPDKSRLSKRHGTTSVMAYRDQGIVPEAFRNFLALLGWTPGHSAKQAGEKDREIFGSSELVELFSLDGISHSNAVFDVDKLAWFNVEWIRRYSPEKLLPLIEEEWDKAEFRPDRSAAEIFAAIRLLQPRARNLKDFAGAFRAYFADRYEYDPEAVAKFLKDAATRELLVELGGRYGSATDFSEAAAETLLRTFAEEKAVKAGILINGARVALTGQAVAPSLFAVMALLGRERVVARLSSAKTIAG